VGKPRATSAWRFRCLVLSRSRGLVALRQTFVHGCQSGRHAVSATGSATTLSSGAVRTIQLTTRAYEPSQPRY
jgi:hypothetical protein